MYTKQIGTQLNQSSQPNFAFAIMGMVLLGTGGSYAINRAEEWRDHIQPRVAFSFNKTDALTDTSPRPDIRTAIEHIENIRSVLNPSIADLANLCDITRQAIYKWLSGDSTPEPVNLHRIMALSQIADTFATAKVSRASSLLKMKAFNGQSLLDLLKTGKNCNDQVATLIAEAKSMEASYKRSGLASSKAKSTNDWQSYISIPGSTEA